MAEYAALPSHVKLNVQGEYVKERGFVPRNSYIPIQRKRSFGNAKFTQLLPCNVLVLNVPLIANLKVNPCFKESSTKCYCLGSLINYDGETISDWVPVVDQVLLMASVILTYMAGILPAQKPLLNPQKNILDDHVVSENSTFYEKDEDFTLKFAWDIVEEKLLDSLNATERGGNLDNRDVGFEPDTANRPLSLSAITEGPRLQLLWASFQWLKKEVDGISESSAVICTNDWLKVFFEIVQKSCQPVCMAWLEKELCLKNSKTNKGLLSLVVEKLEGNDTTLQSITMSGKKNLYAELIHFLRFGSLRAGCCYDNSVFIKHGVGILEDMVITLADGIASRYLELISVDGTMSNEMNSVGLVMCTLSTRALQRLRNEVALNQWLHQNMEAIVSMYEDRFDLRTLQSQLIEQPRKNQTDNFSWWKKLSLNKSSSTVYRLRSVVISYISIPVKRTEELRALTGWRYYFSLFLELSDITMPLIRTLISKISEAISFFLVCLIGRSLGLIYTGIRQSLRWK